MYAASHKQPYLAILLSRQGPPDLSPLVEKLPGCGSVSENEQVTA